MSQSYSIMNVAAGKICEAMITWSNTNTKLMTLEQEIRERGARVLSKIQDEGVQTSIASAENQQNAMQKQAIGDYIAGGISLGSCVGSVGLSKVSFSDDGIKLQMSKISGFKNSLNSPGAQKTLVSAPGGGTLRDDNIVNTWKGSATREPVFDTHDPSSRAELQQMTTLDDDERAYIDRNADKQLRDLGMRLESHSTNRANTWAERLNMGCNGASTGAKAHAQYISAPMQNESAKEHAYADLLRSLEGSFGAFIANAQQQANSNQQTAIQNAANVSVYIATAA